MTHDVPCAHATSGARVINRIIPLALPLALGTLSLAAVAVVGARVRLVPPLVALGLFALAMLGGGGLSLLLGIIGLVRGGEARGPALAAALIGGGCVAALVVLGAAGARGAPPIHDISTDLEDPPAFEAAQLAANRGRGLGYPNGATDSARQQREAYPDVRPLETSMAPGEAYAAALAAARELGWTVVERRPEEGTFEATAETSVFRFVDDVVVRIRPTASGSVIDVRSLSRVGAGDMGANAARIRAFRDVLSR